MEILTTITALLSIVNTALDLKPKLKDNIKREDLASWLLDVAVLLQSIPNDFRNGRYPYAKCSQLHYFLSNIKEILEHYTSEENINLLTHTIENAYQIERLFGELQLLDNDTQREFNLIKLEEASGTFLAASQTIGRF